MTLIGKGFYIWKILQCNGGDINSILDDCLASDLTHVLVKIADGDRKYNFNKVNNTDLVAPLAKLLKENGIKVWGWQYLYGDDPINEARVSHQRIKELDLDGYVANAEIEFKESGMDVVATEFMQEMRKELPDLPMALSSYRYPNYHSQFPYSEFLKYCDYTMPQVYWQGRHNPATQLKRSMEVYKSIEPNRPFIPTGSAYYVDGWEPTLEDMKEFMDTTVELGIPATNFWSWDFCRKNMPNHWDFIRDYKWEKAPESKDITEEYIEALNNKDILKLTTLYTPNGVHIDADRTIQGKEKIMSWFNNFLDQIFPEAIFKLTGKTGNRNSRHFSWEATAKDGNVVNGKDTFGLRDGKISYHFTNSYSV